MYKKIYILSKYFKSSAFDGTRSRRGKSMYFIYYLTIKKNFNTAFPTGGDRQANFLLG